MSFYIGIMRGGGTKCRVVFFVLGRETSVGDGSTNEIYIWLLLHHSSRITSEKLCVGVTFRAFFSAQE